MTSVSNDNAADRAAAVARRARVADAEGARNQPAQTPAPQVSEKQPAEQQRPSADVQRANRARVAGDEQQARSRIETKPAPEATSAPPLKRGLQEGPTRADDVKPAVANDQVLAAGEVESTRAQKLDAMGALDKASVSAAGPDTPRETDNPHLGRHERVNRVVDLMARRMGTDPSKLTAAERRTILDAAGRLARTLSQNGNINRGYQVLERALLSGRLGVGVAGIPGPGGGIRSEQSLEETRRHMSTAGGQRVDAVLDNNNGAPQAFGARTNEQQARELRELTQTMNRLGVRVDVTAHSNGFNALARVARDSDPPVRFGNVSLVNPNVPSRTGDTARDMRAIVGRSEHVALTTAINDGAIAVSGAGVRNGGRGWMNQITAAVRAGVHEINVLTRAGHGLDSVSEHRDREPPNLDFHRNPTSGRMEPRDPHAWQQHTGYRWTGDGFVYDPMRRPRVGPRDR